MYRCQMQPCNSIFKLKTLLCITCWFGFTIQWYINLCGLSSARAILVEGRKWFYLTHSCENKGAYTFSEDISSKVNVIVWLEFKFTYVTIKHVSYSTMGDSFCLALILQMMNRNFMEEKYSRLLCYIYLTNSLKMNLS